MKLFEALKETESSIQYKQSYQSMFGSYEDIGFRMFNSIKINEDLIMSIQGSYAHYCSPRQTLPLEQYTKMEFALIDNKTGEFKSVSQVLPNFSKLEEIEEHYNSVYGYVPVELINKLYLELKGE